MNVGFLFRRLVMGMAALSLLGGCSVGPVILKDNSYRYNVAVSHSQHEALLLNLVRIRYSEPVFFLKTSAIAASFSVTGSLSTSLDLPDQKMVQAGVVGVSHYKVGGSYGESPTISYTPLGGQEYISRLLEEITQEHFLLLFRSGVTLEALAGTLVERFGEHYNSPGRSVGGLGPGLSYEHFLELVTFLGSLQERGDLEMIEAKTTADDGSDTGNRIFMVQCRCLNAEEVDRLDRLLNVKTHRLSIKRTSGDAIVSTFAVTNARDLTGRFTKILDFPVISISMRSFIEVLYHLARGVDIPEPDLEKNLARPLALDDGDAFRRMIHIRNQTTQPSNAFIAIEYRGRYYYIDDSDLDSKEVFLFLSSLFELQSGNVKTSDPILTLPIGGH